MYNYNSNGSRAASARGFMALFAILAMGLGLPASRAEAAPFAYVADSAGTVSVVDTATNIVVATVPVGDLPSAVAVTPDGTRAYVANQGNTLGGSVSVIDTVTNKVIATVAVPPGSETIGVAVTPDGKHVYAVSEASGTLSVIATATNTVVATVNLLNEVTGIAITPDGKHA